MPSEHYDIDTIERYLTHGMGKEERAAFEDRLQQDEGYRQELDAYQSVLGGFQALRGETFRRQMAGWEQQWAKAGNDDTELIEWYIQGELAGEARRQVEQRMQEDESFAREVAAYRQVHEGFEAARTEVFREKIVEWEKNTPQPAAIRVAARRPLWPRLAAAAAILLLLAFSFNWYLQANFSKTAIAGAYYRPPLDGATMGGEPTAEEAVSQSFQAAHRLFEQQQFPAAYQAFGALLARLPNAPIDELSRTNYRENSEWNRLLAALAMDTPPLDVPTEAQRIAATKGHEFQQQAQSLLRKLNAPWFRWVN